MKSHWLRPIEDASWSQSFLARNSPRDTTSGHLCRAWRSARLWVS